VKRLIRNKYVVLSLAGGLVAVGVGGILGDVPSKIAGIGSPADLLAIMAGRSPGSRAEGALLNKTKRPLVAVPKQKKLAEKDTPVVAMAAPPVAIAAAPLLAPAAVIPAAAAIPVAGSGFFLPPFIIPLGGGGGGITTITPPPGGGGNPPPPPPPPPPPGPAVPEPETWLMLTLGFGALGGILRMRRKRLGVQRAHAQSAGTAQRC
jgi:hypothetical protein